MVGRVQSVVGQWCQVPAGLRAHCFCEVNLVTDGTERARAEEFIELTPALTKERYLAFTLTCPYCGRGVLFYTNISVPR